MASAAPGKQTGGSKGETTPDLSTSEEQQNNSSGVQLPTHAPRDEVICLKMYKLSEQTGLDLLSGQCSFP